MSVAQRNRPAAREIVAAGRQPPTARRARPARPCRRRPQAAARRRPAATTAARPAASLRTLPWSASAKKNTMPMSFDGEVQACWRCAGSSRDRRFAQTSATDRAGDEQERVVETRSAMTPGGERARGIRSERSTWTKLAPSRPSTGRIATKTTTAPDGTSARDTSTLANRRQRRVSLVTTASRPRRATERARRLRAWRGREDARGRPQRREHARRPARLGHGDDRGGARRARPA